MPFSFARSILAGGLGQSTGILTSSTSSVNEGSSVTFTLPVFGYSDGDTFPYTITGIQSADISQSLTGNMTVSGDSATVTISAVADNTTEGSQVMTFSADSQSVSVTIVDTSLSPPTYSLSQSPAYATPGNAITYTLTTTNVANGTVIPYTIGNKSPFQQYSYAGNYGLFEPGTSGSNTGSFTISNNSATASETIRSTITRQGPATYNLALNNGGANIDTQIRTNAANGWGASFPISGGSVNNISSNSYSESVSMGYHCYNRMVIFGIAWNNQSGSSTPNISSVRIGSRYASGSTGGIIQSGGSQRYKAAVAYIYLPTSVNSNNTDTVTITFASSMTNGSVKFRVYPISGGITYGYPVVHDYDTANVSPNVSGQLLTNVNTSVNVSGDTKYFLVSVAGCGDTSSSVGPGGYSHTWGGRQTLNGSWNVSSSYGTYAWADNLSNFTYFGNYSSHDVYFRFSTYAGGSMATAVFK